MAATLDVRVTDPVDLGSLGADPVITSARYGTLSNEAFASTVFRDVTGRTLDAEGDVSVRSLARLLSAGFSIDLAPHRGIAPVISAAPA